MDDKEEAKADIYKGLGCILWIIAFAMITFLMFHGAELAEIVMDNLR